MVNFQIFQAKPQDIPQILSIMDEVFGHNPKLPELMQKWISEENYNVLVGKLAEKVIAVAAVYIKTDTQLERYETFGQQAVDFMKGQRLGWFLSLAVKSEWRQLGFGRQLAKAQLPWFIDKKCTVLMGSSWDNGTDSNSRPLYESAGFKHLGESQEFLRRQSRETGFVCSVCFGECQCRSILFGLPLV